MALKFNRNFKNGRQSEQFLNDELITLYEMLKYLRHYKTDEEYQGRMPPAAKLEGALNVQPSDEALNYWDAGKRKWVPFFKSKFQIVDQILSYVEPANPVLGQLWINNGLLCYFDGAQWRPIKSIQMDDSQWSTAAFSDFQIVSPLNPTRESVVEIGGTSYVINETTALESPLDNYWKYYHDNQIDYITNNEVIGNGTTWTPDWESPELSLPEQLIISEQAKSQFLVPNIKTDRIFLEHDLDHSYDTKTSICIEYPTKKILEQNVTAIHLNPGKLTGIKKRLIKVDKINSTIAVQAHNTEFYGFRNGENIGDLLIPSETQDWGDYIPAGDHIILNYTANQNYDYILAITYEFTWMRADGSMARLTPNDIGNAFYVANLRQPVNVHVNGFKLEEASYNVDLQNKTVVLDESVSDVSVEMWSPYRKQFGYIRETDLNNRGIIHLHEPVHIPLVFVGGTLIHPQYNTFNNISETHDGLEFSENGEYIYVPNSGNFNQMINMQWCVVDLLSEEEVEQYRETGHTMASVADWVSGPHDRFEEPDEMYYAGYFNNPPDVTAINDFIMTSGHLEGTSGIVIYYDNTMIGPEDGIILFINGLLISEHDIIRDHENGTITVNGNMDEDMEYVLLKDINGAIYNSMNMLPAFPTGYVSDSLVYINGKLLCNTDCVLTLNTPEMEMRNGAADNEIKYFVSDEITGQGTWMIYDQFTYTWNPLTPEEDENISLIVSSYENLLTSVKFNIEYEKTVDDVVIYSFKFANDLAGLTEVGNAIWYKQDETDDVPIFILDNGYYGYGQGMLNVYKNGVKLVKDRDYEEMTNGKTFRLLTDYEDSDVFQTVIEILEHGYDTGHTTVLLTKDNALQTNIYKIPDESNISLYPGRLTVYVNGIRIPSTDWTLLGTKTIMLKYSDFKASGSANNYPEEILFNEETSTPVTFTHHYPDEIMVEIRYDYDRQEKTILLDNDSFDVDIEASDLDPAILETKDEILFFLNGQFAGLSRNKNSDYRLDRYHGCISFMNPDFITAMQTDKLLNLFDQNNYAYTAWKQMHNKTEYKSQLKNWLTIVWR